MEIYILRHGIAEDPKHGQPDSERALTDEGRDKLRRVLKRARTAGVTPSAILSSPYRRAVETADVAAKELDFAGKVQHTRALIPEAPPSEIWHELRALKDEPSVLLASHEPLTGRLAAYLLGSPALQVDVKKGALIRIDCDRVGTEPRGVLKWMLTARVTA
jgi:phosphohistidine phosphatase